MGSSKSSKPKKALSDTSKASRKGPKKSTKCKTAKKADEKPKKLATTTFSAAQRVLEEATKNNGQSEKTTTSYDGHVQRAQKFIAALANEEAKMDEVWDMNKGYLGFNEEEDDDNTGNGMDVDMESREEGGPAASGMPPELPYALAGEPIKCTPFAIALFMTHKCFVEDCGPSTADGIHAALLSHYNHLDKDGTYRDKWHFDKEKQAWVGNPCRSAIVQDTYRACKHKDGEPERRHSRAMRIEDMTKVHEYFLKDCPKLEEVTDSESLKARTDMLLYMALSTLGWTVWTRNSEITNLQMKHLDFTPPPPPRESSSVPFECYDTFTVNLRNRKNWQRKYEKGEHQLYGHLYYIYPQPQDPAVDVHFHLKQWLKFYGDVLLKRPLQPDDYLFPKIDGPGNVHPKTPMSHPCVQKLINDVATATNLTGAGYFKTHCFRRGGSQYRFMYAPHRERWPMARIRWWGGWAQRESRDTLIRYLLDELSTYEEDHSNAMCPHGPVEHFAQLDGDLETREPTAAEHKEYFVATMKEMRHLVAKCESLERSVTTLQQTLPEQIRTTVASAATGTGLVGSHLSSYGPFSAHQNCQPPVHQRFQSACRPQGPLPLPVSVPHALPHVQPLLSQHAISATSTIASSPSTQLPVVQYQPPSQPIPNIGAQNSMFLSSLTGHIIPEIKRSLGADGWLQVVKDWESPDPSRNHLVALRDWPKEWQRKAGMQYHYRKTIAFEFIERYNRDNERFCTDYPAHAAGITALFKEITARGKAEGRVKTRQRRAS